MIKGSTDTGLTVLWNQSKTDVLRDKEKEEGALESLSSQQLYMYLEQEAGRESIFGRVKGNPPS